MYYHHSCALRITGLQVASGNKGLIVCNTSKLTEEVNNGTDSKKDEKIRYLKNKVKELMIQNDAIDEKFEKIH